MPPAGGEPLIRTVVDGKEDAPAEAIRERELQEALDASRELTRGILAAVPAGVVHVAADGSVRTANAEALRLLGLRYDELTSRYTQDFDPVTIHEDGSPFSASEYPVTRAIASGEAQPEVTIGVKKPDGELSWCVFRAVPVKNASGATTGAVVTFHDITERKRIGDALRRSEAEMKAIVASAPGIIFTADLEGRLTFVNRTAPGLDVDPAAVIGHAIVDWVNEDDRPLLREKLRRAVSERRIVEFEARGLAGVDPNVYSTCLGPIVRDDRVVGVAGVVTIVNERKRAEEERGRLLAQLHEARRLEALGRLAGGVAHDFNNLLTVILSSIDLLRDDPRAGGLRAALDDIGGAADRAAALTRQLLAFGRQQTLEPSVLRLSAVVDRTLPLVRRMLLSHVEVVVEHAPAPHVRADPVQLERVLLNLLTNAQDAMPRGGVARVRTHEAAVGEGELATVPPGRYAVLEVADEGAGMDEEVLSHLFEPFYTTKSPGEGTGLGLATVHGIVAQSGGHIVVESAPGKGSRFCVFLPAVGGAAAPAEASFARAARNGGSETVLLVEDERHVRDVTRHILEAEGYRVIIAESSEAALDLDDAALGSVDLLLTDVVMPGPSGLVLASRLRARAPQMRVLLMSGYVNGGSAALPPGCDFLAKPFDLETLCCKVRSVLDARPQ